MTDKQWFKLCFRWWANYTRFVLDNERSMRDNSINIPPKGWVS